MSSPQKNKQSANKIRIIAGSWRGRKLNVPNEIGLRPTGDRVRETLFNWIAADIPGARCLDAFAGTGVLGLEALSRGAASADFIEQEPRTAETLRDNLALLKAKSGHVHCTSFMQWQPDASEPYDIVFFDPPFAQNLWQSALLHLVNYVNLHKRSLVYVEQPTNNQVTVPIEWHIIKQKRFGAVAATVYETSHVNHDRISS